MIPSISTIDTFVDALTDAEFAEHLAVVVASNTRLQPAGRAMIQKLKRPRENRMLRAMVYETFAPRRVPVPTGELPDFDVT